MEKAPAEKPAGKKGLGLNILRILKDHSDADHPLLQKRIIDLLGDLYQMEADRKTVRHNLSLLVEMGFPVEHNEDGWYYEHEFTAPEICLLIDSLPDSLSASHRAQLVNKLIGLGSKYMAAEDDHRNTPADQELMYTLDVLREAIHRRCMVVFHYGHHDTDKKLHLKAHHDGRLRDYKVSPYRTVISSGHYLMLGNTCPYDGITHYRIDRIRDIRLLETEKAVPLSNVHGSLADVASYLSQRPYMFSDDPVSVCFRISRRCVDDVLDWFGMDVHFHKINEAIVEVDTRVSPTAMKYWCLQYGENCELISPANLRESIARAVMGMNEKYSTDQTGTGPAKE